MQAYTSVATIHELPLPPPLVFTLQFLSGGFVQEEPDRGVWLQVDMPEYGRVWSVHGQERSVRSLH